MFIPYLGSKYKFADFIINNLPSDYETYVEPFGGAFSIYFELENREKNWYVYNDINEYNYLVIKYLSENKFIEYFKNIFVDKEVYLKIQKEFYDNNWIEYQKAANWLILLLCSKSQYDIINSGVYMGNFNFESFKLKIDNYQNKLSKINSIHKLDYKEILKKYDSEKTLFYLDPPYKNLEHYYINHNFTHESHFELSELLSKIKGKFMLSYYYFPEIEDWYKGCRIDKKKTLMGTEYLIMNY